MALITCPDCGNQYDDSLANCPNCGRPNPAREAPRGAAGGAGAAGAGAAGGPYAGGPGGGAYAGGPGGQYAGGPGGPGGPGGYGGAPNIPNYLVQAILVTLCCCLPTGIVAIIKSSQVNSRRDQGDIAGAWAASAEAKKWCWISVGAGIVAQILLWVLWGAWILAIIGMSAAESGATNY
ncbi:MAG TPA: CD225/dispanin family protein [Longimicrobium sp.]|jgi:hypothetical protein